MTWTCYETGIPPVMDERTARAFYAVAVDHAEYPEFEGWLWDMERSGTLFRHEG